MGERNHWRDYALSAEAALIGLDDTIAAAQRDLADIAKARADLEIREARTRERIETFLYVKSQFAKSIAGMTYRTKSELAAKIAKAEANVGRKGDGDE